MFEAAPFLVEQPAKGALISTHWTCAADGRRLRIGVMHADNAWGTVHLFNGRTEYIEKYTDVMAGLCAAGLHVITLDWRGQGLSDRTGRRPKVGHVEDFAEYQRDIDALWHVHAQMLALNLPVFMIGHSMGGMIATRRLMHDTRYAAAMLSGPMHGIRLPAWRKFGAQVFLNLPRGWIDQHRAVPGHTEQSHILYTPFALNALTHDEASYAQMAEQLRRFPALELGGPSYQWLRAAFAEIKAVARAPAPKTPALIFLGDRETIVCADTVKAQAAKWPGAELVILERTKHECLMEGSKAQAERIAQTVAFFKAHL